jgi:hypothetical protein
VRGLRRCLSASAPEGQSEAPHSAALQKRYHRTRWRSSPNGCVRCPRPTGNASLRCSPKSESAPRPRGEPIRFSGSGPIGGSTLRRPCLSWSAD